MKRIFAKRFLTVLAFLFAFALLINANVAKANAEETGASSEETGVVEAEKDPKQGFIDNASKLPDASTWDDKYYSDRDFFELLQKTDLYYRSLSASEVKEINTAYPATLNYDYVVTTKKFKEAIDLASEINELTGRLTYIAGALPINQIDGAYVDKVELSYASIDAQLKGYVVFASDPSKIADAKAEVAKYKQLNEEAIAAIQAILYLKDGAMVADSTGKIVLASKDTFTAAKKYFSAVDYDGLSDDQIAALEELNIDTTESLGEILEAYAKKVNVDDAIKLGLYEEGKVSPRDYELIVDALEKDLKAEYDVAKAAWKKLYQDVLDTKALIDELYEESDINFTTLENVYTNFAKIEKLQKMYENLQTLQAEGNNFNNVYDELKLLDAEAPAKYDTIIAAYNTLQAKIDEVEKLIKKLEGIADADVYTAAKYHDDPETSFAKMMAAQNAFNKLPLDLQAASKEYKEDAVENYEILEKFVEAYNKKIAEIEAVDEAIKKAWKAYEDSSKNPTLDYELEKLYSEMNNKYDALSEAQKADIANKKLLDKTRASIDKLLKEANEISKKIDDLYYAYEHGQIVVENSYMRDVKETREQYDEFVEKVTNEDGTVSVNVTKANLIKNIDKLEKIEAAIEEQTKDIKGWQAKVNEAWAACTNEEGDIELVYGENGNYKLIEEAETLYNGLNNTLKQAAQSYYKDTYDKYDALVKALEAIEKAIEELAEKMENLKKLSTVTMNSASLKAYIDEVDACTTALEALGTFGEKLKAEYAEEYANYVEISSKDAPAAKVEKAIVDALYDTVADAYRTELTIANANDVEDANDLYEALNDAQKALVRNYVDDEDDTSVNTLEEALAIIAEITKKLNTWIEKVEALVEETKQTVAGEQIVVVDLSDAGKLAQLEKEYANFNADEKAYNPIVEAYAKLTKVRADGVAVVTAPTTGLNDRIQAIILVTTFDVEDIEELTAIKDIYDALHESQQALVVDYDKFNKQYEIVKIIQSFEEAVKTIDETLTKHDGEVTEEIVIMVQIVKTIYVQHGLDKIISADVKALYEGLEAKCEGKEVINLIDTKNALIEDIESLSKDLEEKAKQIAALNTALEEAKAALEANDSEISSLITALEKNYKNADESIKSAYEDAIEAAKSELTKALSDQETALKAAIAKAESAASSNLTEAKEELTKAYKDADSALKADYDEQIAKAKEELEAKITAQIAELTALLKAAKEASDAQLETTRSALEQAYKDADSAVKEAYEDAINDAKAELEVEIAALKAQLEADKAELDKAISALEKSQKTATVVICVVFGLISAGLGTCVFLLFRRKVA